MSDNMGLVPMSAELTMFYHDFESSLAFAAQQERERIIKLLEDSEVRAKWIEATSKSLPTYQGVVDFFTSLIKGEQK